MTVLLRIAIIGKWMPCHQVLQHDHPQHHFFILNSACFKDIQIIKSADLVLLDWNSEEIGLNTLKTLKNHCPNTAILMVNKHQYKIRRAMLNGAMAVLDYPIDSQDFEGLLWDVCDELKRSK